MNPVTLGLIAITLVLYAAGFGLLWYAAGWMPALAVVLVLWAHTIESRWQ